MKETINISYATCNFGSQRRTYYLLQSLIFINPKGKITYENELTSVNHNFNTRDMYKNVFYPLKLDNLPLVHTNFRHLSAYVSPNPCSDNKDNILIDLRVFFKHIVCFLSDLSPIIDYACH